VKGPVRDALYRGHIVDKIGEEHFFMRIKHAVDYYDEKHQKTYSQYTLQTNE
jgi:SulP family sulfate permease